MRAELDGFLSRDFDDSLAPPMDLGLAAPAEYLSEEVEIRDARPLEAEAASAADFFARHGFALLKHRSQVSDWGNAQIPAYMGEIASLLRDRLLPDRRIETFPGLVVRRGPNRRHYAKRIHADGPLTAEDYALNVAAVGGRAAMEEWQRQYARDEVAGFLSVGFWRTINMRQPLQHLPLSMCDPNSIARKDIVPTTSTTIAPNGRTTHHLVLRHDPKQAWYYYPQMTTDEVVVMKACEFWKDDPAAHPQNVFHTAFDDPTTPADAEQRQSCDHRLGVWIYRD
jgi:hypothetical protein